MKTTKKTKSNVPNEVKKSDKMTHLNMKDLATLNRLFGKVQASHKRLTKEYDKAYRDIDNELLGMKRSAEEWSKKFNDFRDRMPKTKFDCATGQYFYADSGDGKEVFAIRVTRSETVDFRVSASSEADAIAIAENMAKKGVLKFLAKKITAEDMSR